MRRSSVRLYGYFLRLGATGFGGPIALVGRMEKDLVQERSWFTSEEFAEGLALAQLAPGPLAAQLAIYLGWLKQGAIGASLAALAFIAPSFVMVLALSALYVRFGGMAWIRGCFYGIGAAVIGLIARSAWALTRRAIKADALLWVLWAINFLVVALTSSEVVWVFVMSGVVALLARRARRLQATAASVPALLQLFGFFAKASVVVFGSGLAIVPFLYGGVVTGHRWLTESQFLDAIAVSMITPGPVVITVAFIGYLVAGSTGAFAAAAGVFLPVWLIVVLAAPHYRRLTGSAGVRAFVGGVTAAAVGGLCGAVIVLARRSIVDPATILIAIAALGLPMLVRRIPEPLIIAVAGMVGVLIAG
ncbi:MAG TPA: chromate efflux transporter [Gemmatimonadales bacterium]